MIEQVINAEKVVRLVDYQEKSIVSRTILKKSTGTVTLFAFSKGQALSEHSTPYDALLQVVDGQAEVMISGEIFLVEAGEMILLPANDPHAVMAVESFKMMLIMIKS